MGLNGDENSNLRNSSEASIGSHPGCAWPENFEIIIQVTLYVNTGIPKVPDLRGGGFPRIFFQGEL